MDIFLTKMHRFRRPLITPWTRIAYFYDGWTLFGASKSVVPFTPIKKLGRTRIFFGWKRSYTPRMVWGWV